MPLGGSSKNHVASLLNAQQPSTSKKSPGTH